MKKSIITVALAAAIPAAAFADDKPATDAGKEKAKTEKKEAVAPTLVKVGEMTFKAPSGWTAGEPSSRMVAAFLEVEPGKDLEKVGAKFYHFGGGQGGSTKANVARWISQFEGEPKVEEKVVDKKDGKKVTFVHATGTYLDGPPFGEKVSKEGYALHGAIIEGGESPIFIKMTGPEKSVEAVMEAFEKLAVSPFE